MEVGSAAEHERERKEFLAVGIADFRLIYEKVVEGFGEMAGGNPREEADRGHKAVTVCSDHVPRITPNPKVNPCRHPDQRF